ncbi:hypothetical protein BHM03_00058337 [Ensete ventricosum]|nr:hypothetical protein BHM03_00058337 [Ensete ventricosum]
MCKRLILPREVVYLCIPDPDGEDEGGQASSSLAVSTRWISLLPAGPCGLAAGGRPLRARREQSPLASAPLTAAPAGWLQPTMPVGGRSPCGWLPHEGAGCGWSAATARGLAVAMPGALHLVLSLRKRSKNA